MPTLTEPTLPSTLTLAGIISIAIVPSGLGRSSIKVWSGTSSVGMSLSGALVKYPRMARSTACCQSVEV